MKREPFIAQRRKRWRRLEALLAGGRNDRLSRAELPRLYRQVCQDLALAKHRRYGPDLIDRLNRLALGGHEQLYRRRPSFWSTVARFVSTEFPAVIRANAASFWTANALFWGPFAIMMLVGWLQPEALEHVLGPETARSVEEMYSPENHRVGRPSDDDVLMFGFYILNNVGLAFRTFAWGLVFGIGSVFALVYNGVFIGAIFAHLSVVGYGPQLYPFVVGHGSFELMAIVLAGMAGLKLGFAVLAPGRRTRVRALTETGRVCAKLVYGAAGMLVIAAFIEGFWSPSGVSSSVKYTVGAIGWIAVLSYFAFAGRRRGS